MQMMQPRPMTTDEFLAWENRQELRYEFDGFEPIAMAGGTAAHSAIQRNVIVALGIRLRGAPCKLHGSELKIRVGDGSIRYPDAFVVCTPVAPSSTVVADPVVVFEILSSSSANDDLVVKNHEYRATPSILRYVVLQQTHAGATIFSRKGDDWVAETAFGGAVLHTPEIGVSVPLQEFYEGVPLGAAQADEAVAPS